MSNELRTLFVDSAQAERQSDGSFRIILREQMEVDIENVLYLDDLSVCGQLPMVSNHSSKVYVIEQTPKNFDYLPFRPKLPDCLLYTSPSPRDMRRSRMPSSA